LPDPVAPGGQQVVEITVDGEPVRCTEGQSLAAGMIAAGRPTWRRTRVEHADRGLFCGIGVCFDCLVTVNGVRSVRACLSAARPGDAVVTERPSGGPDDAG
jgi:aerobic-type carbon monoxide dehydrogenase small subunit (CoxS/CutS family)